MSRTQASSGASSRPLRVGVIGVGYMGRLHAEKLATLSREDEALEFVDHGQLGSRFHLPKMARDVCSRA